MKNPMPRVGDEIEVTRTGRVTYIEDSGGPTYRMRLHNTLPGSTWIVSRDDETGTVIKILRRALAPEPPRLSVVVTKRMDNGVVGAWRRMSSGWTNAGSYEVLSWATLFSNREILATYGPDGNPL